MNTKNFLSAIFCGVILSIIVALSAVADPVSNVDKKERCPVCGMFVFKYQPWITQIVLSDGQVVMFDGAKDMLAFFFEPRKYGIGKGVETREIWVKDYYTQDWKDGKECFYVIGSDVYGPMGHEFIPFDSVEAADNFVKDHHGKRIVKFDDISLELVNSKRSGQTMKGR